MNFGNYRTKSMPVRQYSYVRNRTEQEHQERDHYRVGKRRR